jgi:SAM-dependent methyltransferase
MKPNASERLELTRRSEPFWPTKDELALIQAVSVRIAETLSEKPSWFDYYVRNHTVRIAFDLQLADSYLSKTEPIVEFGSTPLLLTAALSARGYRVTGVDVEPDRFAGVANRLGLEIVRCDIERELLPFADGAFSSALFNEIFEHLRIDLVHTFREVRRVLKPGGRLLLSTPNGRSYSNLLNLLLRDRGLDSGVYESFEALHTVGHMGHVREYTVTDVAEFLTKAGFQCEEVIYRGRFSTNVGQAIARLLPQFRPHFTIIAYRT